MAQWIVAEPCHLRAALALFRHPSINYCCLHEDDAQNMPGKFAIDRAKMLVCQSPESPNVLQPSDEGHDLTASPTAETSMHESCLLKPEGIHDAKYSFNGLGHSKTYGPSRRRRHYEHRFQQYTFRRYRLRLPLASSVLCCVEGQNRRTPMGTLGETLHLAFAAYHREYTRCRLVRSHRYIPSLSIIYWSTGAAFVLAKCSSS